jgi:hypothetical protein
LSCSFNRRFVLAVSTIEMIIDYIDGIQLSSWRFGELTRFHHPSRDLRLIKSAREGELGKEIPFGRIYLDVLLQRKESDRHKAKVAVAFAFSYVRREVPHFLAWAQPFLNDRSKDGRAVFLTIAKVEKLIPWIFVGRISALKRIPRAVHVRICSEPSDAPDLEHSLQAAFRSFNIFTPAKQRGPLFCDFVPVVATPSWEDLLSPPSSSSTDVASGVEDDRE